MDARHVLRSVLATLVGALVTGGFVVRFTVVSAAEDSGAVTRDLPPAPVLTVSAGVLPTSPFRFLDRFDEWLQGTIFTFGVRRLRAYDALATASERVAELQVLETQGLRTDARTTSALAELGDRLEFAARVAGEEFAAGGRPVALATRVIRTTIASVDALERTIAESEEIWSDVVELPERDLAPGLAGRESMFAVLRELPDRVDAGLLGEPAAVPAQVLDRLALEKLAQASRDVARIESALGSLSPDTIVAGGDALLRAARAALEEAHALVRDGAPQAAMPFTREVREIALLVRSNELLVRRDELLGYPDASDRLERILDRLVSRGLLGSEDAREAQAQTMGLLGVTDAS